MRSQLRLALLLFVTVLVVLAFTLPSAVSAKRDTTPTFDGLTYVTYQDGVFRLVWSPAHDDCTKPGAIAYDVFESDTPDIDSFDFSSPIASPVGVTGIDISGLDTQRQHYFVVRARDKHGRSDDNVAEQADRLLRLTGMPNFRDFGGYINADGQQVRWGLLYRSGALNKLTASDVVKVNSLGLNTVFDLRKPWEVAASPDKIYASNEDLYQFLPFLDDPRMEGITNWFLFDPRIVDVPNMYFNTAERNKEYMRTIFESLADASSLPVLEHCTGGKDRAGTTAALILMLLDVPKDTIVRDYMMTNQVSNLQSTIAYFTAGLANTPGVPEGVTIDDWLPVLGCSQVAIETLVDRINSDYGGIDRYLRSIGVTTQQQRAIKANLLGQLTLPGKPKEH
jgi:protein-tyrosine phosphatase